MCKLDFLSNFMAKSYVQYICLHLQEPVFNSCMDSAIDPGIVLGLAVVRVDAVWAGCRGRARGRVDARASTHIESRARSRLIDAV